jgi:hypothetical protein
VKIAKATAQKSLKKKGFEPDSSGHHVYYHHYMDGKVTGAYTFFSHSSQLKDIDENIQKKMKRQLLLGTAQELRDLLCCPMSQEKYNGIIESQG